MWATTFIATLEGQDSPDWDEGPTVTAEGDTAFQTARVSPNGRYLSFMSQKSLTGYDNEDLSSQHPGERLDEEVYLYDSQTSGLTCVSCDPTGARPAGVLDQKESGEGLGLLVDRRSIWANSQRPSEDHWLAGNIPGWTAQGLTSALFQSRYLSNEGRLFFDSADALVPGLATPTREENIAGRTQQVGVENVYEYEPAGVGGCASRSGGCVALVSSGTSEHESAFLEATPSGQDVFFLTAAQLSTRDTDAAFDIYDARACSESSPCLPAPEGSTPACETAEACHPATPPGSQGSSSGTAIFSGPGNTAQTPAPQQQVESVKSTPKPPTRAQKLSKALTACRKRYRHTKKKRQSCEAHARRLYAPPKNAQHAARSSRPQTGGKR